MSLRCKCVTVKRQINQRYDKLINSPWQWENVASLIWLLHSSGSGWNCSAQSPLFPSDWSVTECIKRSPRGKQWNMKTESGLTAAWKWEQAWIRCDNFNYSNWCWIHFISCHTEHSWWFLMRHSGSNNASIEHPMWFNSTWSSYFLPKNKVNFFVPSLVFTLLLSISFFFTAVILSKFVWKM